MAGGFDVKLLGAKELIAKLQRLQPALQKRVMRPAVNFALTPMNSAARRNAPVETGLLRKSIGKKLKQYARSGTTWGGIGPRSGFGVNVAKGETATVKSGKRTSVIGRSRNPLFYAHLVELGAGGKPGVRFLTKAYQAHKAGAMSRLGAKVEKGIAKEATRK